MNPAPANLILTGLPRSGSAPVSALIDSLPDAVCLNTPPWQVAFARNPVDILPFCKWLVGDFAWSRQKLIEGTPIADIRSGDGTPLLDGMQDARMMRDDEGEPKAVPFTRPALPAQFTLAMRQTTLFTSILPMLVSFQHFTIIAVIRHPVDVCLSWYRMAQPLLSQGNPPGIARYWPEALEALAGGSLPEQFAALYELYVQRYHELGVTVLRYEDVMADPLTVSRMFGHEVLPAAAAQLKPSARPRDVERARALEAALRRIGVFSKLYYPDL